MASGILHRFTDPKSDGGDATIVRPSNWNDDHVATYLSPDGLTGATQASRWVGATTSGAPGSGTFSTGDFVIARDGKIWVCTSGGSPGTWAQIGGGAGVSVPDIVQIAVNGNAATSITIAAAASGHSLILFTNSTTGQVTSPTCTNVTWTAVKQWDDGTGFYTVWVGLVAGGSSGTSITMTKPGSFNTVTLMEVPDALTPTLGANVTAVTDIVGSTVPSTLRLGGTTAGRLLVFCNGIQNTATTGRLWPSGASTGMSDGQGNQMMLGYALSSAAILAYQTASIGMAAIIEIT